MKFFIQFIAAFILTGLSTVQVFAWDANDTTFDPEIFTSITPSGGVLGDPAPFMQLGIDQPGYTYVTHQVIDKIGMRVSASLIVPLAQGQAATSGGGFSMLTIEEAEAMAAALQKAPEWAAIAKENTVGEYAKDVAIITGEVSGDHSKIVFVSNADNEGAMQFEQSIAGAWKKFRFSIPAAQKYATQLTHFAAKARAEKMPDTPKGDAEKDKLFQ